MTREIEVEGTLWRAEALSEEAPREGGDGWHLQRVRFEPVDAPEYPPRETWLRLEEDIPADSVLDQYADEELVEAFLVAEEVDLGAGDEPGD